MKTTSEIFHSSHELWSLNFKFVLFLVTKWREFQNSIEHNFALLHLRGKNDWSYAVSLFNRTCQHALMFLFRSAQCYCKVTLCKIKICSVDSAGTTCLLMRISIWKIFAKFNSFSFKTIFLSNSGI